MAAEMATWLTAPALVAQLGGLLYISDSDATVEGCSISYCYAFGTYAVCTLT